MELHRFFRYAIEKMCKEKKSLNHFIDNKLWNDIKSYAHYECLGTLYGSNEKTFKTIHESGNERQICAYAYWLFYHRYEYCLGHYCRHFYNIIKYIDDYKQKLLSQLNNQSKDYEKEVQTINDKIHHYFSFAQASLSSYELVMIYYNMLLFPNAEKLYKEYNIFENSKHSDKCTFYTLRFDCSFAAANTIKPQLL